MSKWIVAGCMVLLTLMVGFQFVRAEAERYDREHLSFDEAVEEINGGSAELDQIYAQYQLQCKRKGVTVEDLRAGKTC